MKAPELRARKIHVSFGGVKALNGIDVVLRRGELLGLIGPNGAGKTTLINVLTGFQKPDSGDVLVGETTIRGLNPERISRLGIARTFQNIRLFGELSVLENVEVAALAAGMSRRKARERTWNLLERVGLADGANLPADSLPHGEKRRLGMLRAIATEPHFLLLDEPAAGLNEEESREVMTSVALVRDDTMCGVLVIEHDMRFIMGLCERIQVLDHGQTISLGSPDDVQRDPMVIAAYLGSEGETGVAQG